MMPSMQFDAISVPAHATWTATGMERQIFVDHSGRRARRVGVAGLLCAVLSAGWFAGLVGGSFGFTGLPAVGTAPVAGATHAHAVTHVAALRRTALETSAN